MLHFPCHSSFCDSHLKPNLINENTFFLTSYKYYDFGCAQSLSHIWLFAAPWTVDCQAPLPWNSPGKNTGVGCHFLLQGIFLTQGSNSCLLSMKRNTLNTDSDTQPYRGFRGLIQETVHICQKVQQTRSEDAVSLLSGVSEAL